MGGGASKQDAVRANDAGIAPATIPGLTASEGEASRPVTASGSQMGIPVETEAPRAAHSSALTDDGSDHGENVLACSAKAQPVDDWRPAEEEEEEEEEEEATVANGPAEELVREVRATVREHGIHLLQTLQSAGGSAGDSKLDSLDAQQFDHTLRFIVGERKYGLVERGGPELFAALDPQSSGTVRCDAAADALALDTRDNPLRNAGRHVPGSLSSHAGGGEQHVVALAQDTSGAATAGASMAGWTAAHMRQQLDMAAAQLRKLAASKEVRLRVGAHRCTHACTYTRIQKNTWMCVHLVLQGRADDHLVYVQIFVSTSCACLYACMYLSIFESKCLHICRWRRRRRTSRMYACMHLCTYVQTQIYRYLDSHG